MKSGIPIPSLEESKQMLFDYLQSHPHLDTIRQSELLENGIRYITVRMVFRPLRRKYLQEHELIPKRNDTTERTKDREECRLSIVNYYFHRNEL